MPSLKTLTADTPADRLLEVIREDGALILEGAASDAEMDRFMAEMRPWIEATPDGFDDFSGRRTTRTGALVARSAQARDFVTDPRVLELARRFLQPFCLRFQLHLTQIIRLRPGQGAQAIHRDRWAWGKYLQGIEPQFNTIWAATDFTAANGATLVAPGSTTWPDDRLPRPEELCQAEMARGSVLLYTGSVFHGGGENRSDADRVGINLTYSLAWLRQEENQYLSCPPDIARDLPAPLQELLGYTVGSYALGYYTPPLPPGQGPEITGPEFALGRAPRPGLGESDLLDAITGQ